MGGDILSIFVVVVNSTSRDLESKSFEQKGVLTSGAVRALTRYSLAAVRTSDVHRCHLHVRSSERMWVLLILRFHYYPCQILSRTPHGYYKV